MYLVIKAGCTIVATSKSEKQRNSRNVVDTVSRRRLWRTVTMKTMLPQHAVMDSKMFSTTVTKTLIKTSKVNGGTTRSSEVHEEEEFDNDFILIVGCSVHVLTPFQKDSFESAVCQSSDKPPTAKIRCHPYIMLMKTH